MLENKPELKDALKNQTVLITGAGGGIGFEAAKAFVQMGAKVVIAEINREKGLLAEEEINRRFPGSPAEFIEIDLSDGKQVAAMAEDIRQKHGCPDVVFNNATITKMGAVDEVGIEFWDKSYAVNFRAPLLLTQLFLPEMKKRHSGCVVFVSSSGASPYMGAYEVFKTSQVELSNTLAMELENTGVSAFTIGPGLVKTQTAMNAIEIVSKSMGMSTEEFYEMNSHHIIDAESAGTGFALSVIDPAHYHGQEIGSIQVLMDYDILSENKGATEAEIRITEVEVIKAKALLERVISTFEEQYAGWKAMNIFERQWVFRDFKKCMGLSAEQAKEKLSLLSQEAAADPLIISTYLDFLRTLGRYWQHQLDLLLGYEKDKRKLEDNTRIIGGWIEDIGLLTDFFD